MIVECARHCKGKKSNQRLFSPQALFFNVPKQGLVPVPYYNRHFINLKAAKGHLAGGAKMHSISYG
jgi:hypothetical protein